MFFITLSSIVLLIGIITFFFGWWGWEFGYCAGGLIVSIFALIIGFGLSCNSFIDYSIDSPAKSVKMEAHQEGGKWLLSVAADGRYRQFDDPNVVEKAQRKPKFVIRTDYNSYKRVIKETVLFDPTP